VPPASLFYLPVHGTALRHSRTFHAYNGYKLGDPWRMPKPDICMPPPDEESADIIIGTEAEFLTGLVQLQSMTSCPDTFM
jgi:hypothetical protein